jgi:hypothetical protein
MDKKTQGKSLFSLRSSILPTGIGPNEADPSALTHQDRVYARAFLEVIDVNSSVPMCSLFNYHCVTTVTSIHSCHSCRFEFQQQQNGVVIGLQVPGPHIAHIISSHP